MSNATLADTTLAFCSILFAMVGAPAGRKKNRSMQRHLVPHGGRVKIQPQGFSDYFPTLLNIFHTFELNTKATFFLQKLYLTLADVIAVVHVTMDRGNSPPIEGFPKP